MNGFVNGCRYIIESVTNSDFFLQIAFETSNEKRLMLPLVPCKPGEDDSPILGFRRTQFLVRLFFAHTTNKAHGQSFSDAFELDLNLECYSRDLFCVALTRITHPSNIRVFTERVYNITSNVAKKTVSSKH